MSAAKAGPEKTIATICNDEELIFNVSPAEYADFINGMSGPDKINAAYNFLIFCSPQEQKATIKALFPDPGWSLELASYVATEYKPKFNISIKK